MTMSEKHDNMSGNKASIDDGSSIESLGSMRKPLPREEERPVSDDQNPAQFPDGGWQAWCCVAGGFCINFCSMGWVNSMGVFQEYYQRTMLPSYSPSAISWIVSLESFFMFVGGPLIGQFYDRYGPRWLLIVGTFLHFFGLLMTSFSTQYYQILLAQGVCSPIGASLVRYPAMLTVTSWFNKRRGLALGIMVSGASLGGIILPITVSKLIPRIGFGWTMRVCAFLMLALLVIANLSVRSRIPPKRRPLTITDYIKPFREPTFTILCVANFFGFLGLFIPFNYVTLSAIGLGMSANLASYLISMLNAASVFGRIFPGWAADKLGRLNTQTGMTALSAVFVLAVWLPARGNAPVIAFAVLYGFVSGSFIALTPAIVAQLTTDMHNIGVRVGVMYMFVSFAALVGNPIAGALLGDDRGGYLYLQVFTGVVNAVAAALFIFSKFQWHGGKVFHKF